MRFTFVCNVPVSSNPALWFAWTEDQARNISRLYLHPGQAYSCCCCCYSSLLHPQRRQGTWQQCRTRQLRPMRQSSWLMPVFDLCKTRGFFYVEHENWFDCMVQVYTAANSNMGKKVLWVLVCRTNWKGESPCICNRNPLLPSPHTLLSFQEERGDYKQRE